MENLSMDTSELRGRPQLVLDIGGVLATNLTPLFWELAAEKVDVPYEQLYTQYKRSVSDRLWTGAVSEVQFWQWLAQQGRPLDQADGLAFIRRSLTPLPALDKVRAWAETADIHILSNHIAAWTAPLLEPVRDCLASVTISSETGSRKPQADIFRHALARLRSQRYVLFVDDQRKNLDAAESHGWHTLLADPGGLWTRQADHLLQANNE